MTNDYITTIDSESEDFKPESRKKKLDHVDRGAQIDEGFVFDAFGDPELEKYCDGFEEERIEDEDDILSSNNEEDEGDSFGASSREDETIAEDTKISRVNSAHDASSSDDTDSEAETQAERDRKAAYFDSEVTSSEIHSSFLSMNLSRPILKALASLSFQKPTPIQAATIPMALLGKDIVGSAVTGSGKTAAFMVPLLERLLYREKGKHAAATRCLVLVPTRELALQCFQVGSKLASYTDIKFCVIVGGLSLRSQEAELRSRPDVVIGTPGRLIDHLRNSPSFTLDALDVLVLDEADRMLSDGFALELNEIVKSCPVSRQTMLFSATMTDSVDQLIKMSLNKPVRLFVDPKRRIAPSLVQEFVRIRAGKEPERSAMLVALCKRTFKSGVIVFFRSKKLAHQMKILFGLLGMNSGELHGNLSQEQRMQSLKMFRDGSVDFLLATELASRGLDIKGMQTVINYDMPGQLEQYLHRVGRTARAGNKGRSVTLVGEADRKMLKAVIKHSSTADQIRHRALPPEDISEWSKQLEELKDKVAGILSEEKVEAQLRKAEMELRKGENMIEHEAEIYSRAPRTWFQSAGGKYAANGTKKRKDATDVQKQKTSKKDKMETSRKAKRRKLASDDAGNPRIRAAIRSAKKSALPAKIHTHKSFSRGKLSYNK